MAMRTTLLLAWAFFRNVFVGLLFVLACPAFTAGFYTIASALGGNLDNDRGDIALALPLAGAAFLIAVVLVAIFLFPAMCLADGLRIFKSAKSGQSLMAGVSMISIIYLTLALADHNGFSWQVYITGSLFLIILFLLFWTCCTILDYVTNAIVRVLEKRRTR